MSLAEAFVEVGITKQELEMVLKIREPLKKGNSCEVKANKDGGMTVYEVEKRKR